MLPYRSRFSQFILRHGGSSCDPCVPVGAIDCHHLFGHGPGTTLQDWLVKAPVSRRPLTCRRQMAHPILLPPRSFPFCPDPRSGNPLQGNSAVNTSIIGDVRFLGGSDERIQNAAEHILPRSLSQKLLWSLRTSWPSNSSLLAVGGPSRAKRSEALVAMGAILRRLDLTMKHR